MDYFAAMHAFVRAVDLGSFSKAAAESGIKVSTISRYVSALEADLGAALLNRSTRSLHLTEAGVAFHEQATNILAEVEQARFAARALNAKPQGLLRINIPAAFGRRHIVPLLPDFLAEYPDIRIDATLTDTTVDLIASGADLAVRIGALADSTLIARQLAPLCRMLVASPAWLAAHRPITQPHDLDPRDCLEIAHQPKSAWYFGRRDDPMGAPIEVALHGRLRSNDAEALLDAARAGLGVALLPTWLVGGEMRAGRLAELLPEWEGHIAPGPERAIWGVYPPKKVVSPKVRAMLAFLVQRFGKPPYWDQAGTP